MGSERPRSRPRAGAPQERRTPARFERVDVLAATGVSTSANPSPPAPAGPPTRGRAVELVAVAVAFFTAACVVTWPTIIDLGGSFPFSVRRFDGYGVVWFGEHAWRVLRGDVTALHAPEVAWPEGLDLRLADSFLFGLLYLPFRAVLAPVAAFNLFTIVALASTALSGWWLARRVLETGPLAAVAAGFVVGFSSLVHSFRLEGEAYLLAGGFLPLFAGYILRVIWYGRLRDGVVTGVLLAALGWSTGYFGVNGVVVAAVLGPVALLTARRTSVSLRAQVLATLLSVATAFVLLVPLVLLLRGGGGADAIASRFPTGESPLRNVAQDSATLSGLLVPFPASAPLRQDRIFYVGLAGLAICAVAFLVRSPRRTAPWAALLVVSIVFSLGPYLRIDDATTSGPRMPYAWVASVAPQILAYRMPARLLSVAAVALAALVALALDGLRREGVGLRWRVPLLITLVIDGLVFTGAAVDPTGAPARVPEGYAALSRGGGAVFDLFGTDRLLLRYSGRAVFYQVFHGRPVFANFTKADGRMPEVGRRIANALVNVDDAEARRLFDALAAVGATDIALHLSSFPDADQVLIQAGLTRLLGAPGEAPTDTSGDPVTIFRLPPPPQTLDRAAALRTLDALEDE